MGNAAPGNCPQRFFIVNEWNNHYILVLQPLIEWHINVFHTFRLNCSRRHFQNSNWYLKTCTHAGTFHTSTTVPVMVVNCQIANKLLNCISLHCYCSRKEKKFLSLCRSKRIRKKISFNTVKCWRTNELERCKGWQSCPLGDGYWIRKRLEQSSMCPVFLWVLHIWG